MLHIQLDNHSGVAAYRQVMNQIKFYIASGSLTAGDKLPSIRALAKQLAVNPTTIVKTYNELQHEGVIEMRQGKGAFITNDQATYGDAEKREALRPLARKLAVEAKQLGTGDGELLDLLEEEMGKLDR